MNATLLVAIAVTISSIVRSRWGGPTMWRTALFIAQLSVVFVGMIAGGLGILLFNADAPFDSAKSHFLVDPVFLTWILGFIRLAIGIEVSALPPPEPHGPSGHAVTARSPRPRSAAPRSSSRAGGRPSPRSPPSSPT